MREAEEWWTVHFVKKHGRKPWKDMRIIEKQKTIQTYLEAVVGYDADSYVWKYDNYPPQMGTETKDHQTSKKLAEKLKKLQARFARELELGAEGFTITEDGEVGEITKKKTPKPRKAAKKIKKTAKKTTTKTRKPRKKKEPESGFCVKCGSKIATDDMFCTNCGSKR